MVLDALGGFQNNEASDVLRVFFERFDFFPLGELVGVHRLLAVRAEFRVDWVKVQTLGKSRLNKSPAFLRNGKWLRQLFSFPSYFAHPPFGRKPLSSRRFGKSPPPFLFWPKANLPPHLHLSSK